MIKNYCISSLKSLKELPKLDVAQVTLNSRLFPSKRQTVDLLSEMTPYHGADLIIHYDYLYIISRFALLSPAVKNAIVTECVNICNYAHKDQKVKGIIMHTDFPLRQECYNKGVNHQKITDTYTTSIWNVSAIHDLVDKGENLDAVLESSLLEFYNQFHLLNNGEIGCKIYLENTTKVGPNMEGTVNWLSSFLKKYPYTTDLYGLCIDTEHDYAISGTFILPEDIEHIKVTTSADIIVHLNTVPSEVKPKSGKDRHSDTTVFECSVNTVNFYESFIEALNNMNVIYVREVKEEAMYREIDQYGRN